jgi:hypothetical protein
VLRIIDFPLAIIQLDLPPTLEAERAQALLDPAALLLRGGAIRTSRLGEEERVYESWGC